MSMHILLSLAKRSVGSKGTIVLYSEQNLTVERAGVEGGVVRTCRCLAFRESCWNYRDKRDGNF